MEWPLKRPARFKVIDDREPISPINHYSSNVQLAPMLSMFGYFVMGNDFKSTVTSRPNHAKWCIFGFCAVSNGNSPSRRVVGTVCCINLTPALLQQSSHQFVALLRLPDPTLWFNNNGVVRQRCWLPFKWRWVMAGRICSCGKAWRLGVGARCHLHLPAILHNNLANGQLRRTLKRRGHRNSHAYCWYDDHNDSQYLVSAASSSIAGLGRMA